MKRWSSSGVLKIQVGDRSISEKPHCQMTERQSILNIKKPDLQNIFQMIKKDYCGKFRFVGRKTKFVQYHKCILCGYLYQLDLNWKDNPY